jgi:hypothetical protein
MAVVVTTLKTVHFAYAQRGGMPSVTVAKVSAFETFAVGHRRAPEGALCIEYLTHLMHINIDFERAFGSELVASAGRLKLIYQVN